MTKSRGILPPRRTWTSEEDAALRARYPNETAAALAREFCVGLHVLYARANRLGIGKSSEFFASAASGRLDGVRGADCRFAPGNVPWTKGQKGIHMGPLSEFKPGMRPANYMEVGSTKMHMGYEWVKIADGGWPASWRPKHHVIWEQHTGAAPPPSHMLSFKDRNRTNFDLSNLELISRVDWMARHTIHKLPQELADLIRLQAVLNRHINQRGKS